MRILIAALLLAALPLGAPRAEEWQEIKGDHFIIRYLASTVRPPESDYQGDISRFSREVLEKAEIYYGRLASDLGYSRTSEFWTWDKRVKIYVYPDHAAYVRSSGHPEWSHGMADYDRKEISSYAFSANFLTAILPHELAHLVFRDFVGFKGEVPLWLDEGVAQWAEEAKRGAVKRVVKDLYSRASLLSIEDMMKLNLAGIKKTDGLYIRSIVTGNGSRGTLFLSGENLIKTYYIQSVSLVGFLIERYGAGDFAHFCRQLRDGKSLDDGLSAVYPLHIRNLADFEDEWRKYIAEQ